MHLRGGAPFLSPADALCLIGWLDAGVEVPVILAALDRCVVSRRRNRAKRPLTLTAARRHLNKPPLTDPGFTRQADEPPVRPVQTALTALDDPDAHALADALAALPAKEPTQWVTEAVATCRDHQERRWASLAAPERESRIQDAIRDLGDLAALVDEKTLYGLAEEVARETFRAAWPRLDTATFDKLVS